MSAQIYDFGSTRYLNDGLFMALMEGVVGRIPLMVLLHEPKGLRSRTNAETCLVGGIT